MWICYEDALKDYINCCIVEWKSRKNKDGKPKKTKYTILDVPEDIIYPWWTHHSYFLLAFRASLYRKEQERSEPEWYVKKFPSIRVSRFFKHGYIWLPKLTPEVMISLMEKKYCKCEDVCAPPMEPT